MNTSNPPSAAVALSTCLHMAVPSPLRRCSRTTPSGSIWTVLSPGCHHMVQHAESDPSGASITKSRSVEYGHLVGVYLSLPVAS